MSTTAAVEDSEERVEFERKNLTDGEMDITPMIDIVFLLLIFFVVASKMTAEQAPKVPLARSGVSVDIRSAIPLVVSRGDGDVAVVRNIDGRVFSGDADQQTAEITEYVVAEMSKGKTEVLLQAEGNVRGSDMKRILGALNEVLEDGQTINMSVTDEG